MAKRNRETKTAQVINLETTELFQSLSDEQAEAVKGGGVSVSYSISTDFCNRTGKYMTVNSFHKSW